MGSISNGLKDILLDNGAVLVGFGDISQFPPQTRQGLPYGVCVVVAYPKEVIRGIHTLPTREYHEHYNLLNERLDALVTLGYEYLQRAGYAAFAQTREYVRQFYASDQTLQTDSILPYKTFATRAGIGWIGKCALLVTREYGSMVRLSAILTNAPLPLGSPLDVSLCGECDDCTRACPAQAVSGRHWHAGLPREDFYDHAACQTTARERSQLGFGKPVAICGKCIEICPYTRQYLNAD